MKKIMSVYLPLVCLAVMLSSARASSPVLDIQGDEVRAGVEYKIYSLFRVAGGLTLRNTSIKPCPWDVALSGFNACLFGIDCGLPLTFHPEEGDLVSVSADVNIKFETEISGCKESTVLKVVRDESVDTEYVSTGGVLGNQLSAIWFRMEHLVDIPIEESVYHFKYCPRNFTTFLCSDMGFRDGRLIVLKQDEEPFYFTIAKSNFLSSVM